MSAIRSPGIRSPEELWVAVHAALDERRDPLADEQVAAWLTEHADNLESVLRLDRRLRALAPPRRRPATIPALLLATAGALAVVWFLQPRKEAARLSAPLASQTKVLDYRFFVATETPDLRVAATLENGRLVREREMRFEGSNGSGSVSMARLTATTRKEGL